MLGVSDKDNRWIEQPLFYNPNILNAKLYVLRPSDYNIPETRAVSKLKVIDVFRNLKIKEINELAEVGLINLNFLSYTRLKKDVTRNIGLGKKYNGAPKLAQLRRFETLPPCGNYSRIFQKGDQRIEQVQGNNQGTAPS